MTELSLFEDHVECAVPKHGAVYHFPQFERKLQEGRARLVYRLPTLWRSRCRRVPLRRVNRDGKALFQWANRERSRGQDLAAFETLLVLRLPGSAQASWTATGRQSYPAA